MKRLDLARYRVLIAAALITFVIAVALLGYSRWFSQTKSTMGATATDHRSVFHEVAIPNAEHY